MADAGSATEEARGAMTVAMAEDDVVMDAGVVGDAPLDAEDDGVSVASDVTVDLEQMEEEEEEDSGREEITSAEVSAPATEERTVVVEELSAVASSDVVSSNDSGADNAVDVAMEAPAKSPVAIEESAPVAREDGVVVTAGAKIETNDSAADVAMGTETNAVATVDEAPVVQQDPTVVTPDADVEMNNAAMVVENDTSVAEKETLAAQEEPTVVSPTEVEMNEKATDATMGTRSNTLSAPLPAQEGSVRVPTDGEADKSTDATDVAMETENKSAAAVEMVPPNAQDDSDTRTVDAEVEKDNVGAAEPKSNANTNGSSSSSSSDSSDSSDSSSSSSSDSSDSEVEDVTDQYQKPVDPEAPRLRAMSESGDDDVDAEQWFDEPTLESDGMEFVGLVDARPQDGAVTTMGGGDDDDDEEDVFLTPFKPELERGSATKRRRPEDQQEALEIDESAGEETTSSEPDMLSEDEFGRRRASSKATRRKKPRKAAKETPSRKRKSPASSHRPSKIVLQPLDKPLVYKRVPAKYDVFNGVPNDDSNFPFLKGDYHIVNGHRAYFTGLWGFTDADFKPGGFTSKFEYTSGYLHGRRESDRRPFSGTYGGYFNLRQFSGKITKIKEDHIKLCFVKLRQEDENSAISNIPSGHEDEDDDDDDDGVDAQYEVFGEGKNRFGSFLVRGYFSATTGRMTVRRRYLD